MRIMAISDYHGASDLLFSLGHKLEEITPDLLVFCGDAMKGYARGDEWLAAKRENRPPVRDKPEIRAAFEEDEDCLRQFFAELGGHKIPIVCIPGNMDAPLDRYLTIMRELVTQHPNLQLVHDKEVDIAGVRVGGFGGEIVEETEEFFVLMSPADTILKNLNPDLDILLLHSPPVMERIDLDEGAHKGSALVNQFIEQLNPRLVFCGHAHRAQGWELLFNSVVINPGALKYGNAAIVELQRPTKVDFLKI